MPADLLKDVRECVNRHRGRDYAESIRDRMSRERRTRIATGIRNTGAALIFIASVFAVQHLDRIVTEYVTLKEEREEVIELRTKLADLESWDCREYRHSSRDFRWCSRPVGER